jgi:hypothetical protein
VRSLKRNKETVKLFEDGKNVAGFREFMWELL